MPVTLKDGTRTKHLIGIKLEESNNVNLRITSRIVSILSKGSRYCLDLLEEFIIKVSDANDDVNITPLNHTLRNNIVFIQPVDNGYDVSNIVLKDIDGELSFIVVDYCKEMTKKELHKFAKKRVF